MSFPGKIPQSQHFHSRQVGRSNPRGQRESWQGPQGDLNSTAVAWRAGDSGGVRATLQWMRTMRMERLQPATDDPMGMVEVEVSRIWKKHEKTSNEVGCMGGCAWLGQRISSQRNLFFFWRCLWLYSIMLQARSLQ